MTKVVSEEYIRGLKKQGVPVTRGKRHEPKPEDRQFKHVASLLEKILSKPVPTPQVNVSPAKVEFPDPVKKWRFAVERNGDGYISGITAERVE